jgi:hypothetical protein
MPTRIDRDLHPEVGERLPLPRMIESLSRPRLLDRRDDGHTAVEPNRVVLHLLLQPFPRRLQYPPLCLGFPQLGKNQLQRVVAPSTAMALGLMGNHPNTSDWSHQCWFSHRPSHVLAPTVALGSDGSGISRAPQIGHKTPLAVMVRPFPR